MVVNVRATRRRIPVHYVATSSHAQQLLRFREMEERLLMRALDQQYLNNILTDPVFACTITGLIEAAHPDAHPIILTPRDYFMRTWNIEFVMTLKGGHALLRKAVLVDRGELPEITICEVNPRPKPGSHVAQIATRLAAEGHHVYLICVGGEVRGCIADAAHWWPEDASAGDGAREPAALRRA